MPDHNESSFSCSVSLAGSKGAVAPPPKTIAPSRPLPMGSASTHSLAGLLYRSFRLSGFAVAGLAHPSRFPRERYPATVEAVARKRRRVNLLIKLSSQFGCGVRPDGDK